MVYDRPECPLELDEILRFVNPTEFYYHYNLFPKKYLTKTGGYMSKIYTGEVINQDNGETRYVVVKKAYKNCNSEGQELLYKNEIHFYSKIFPKLFQFMRKKGVKFPFNNLPIYLNKKIDDRFMFIAVEDIRILGYELCDRKQYLVSDQLKLIFKTYGKFHALSFAFKKENPEDYENLVRDCTNTLSSWTNVNEIVQFVQDAFASALETFSSETEGDILEKLKKVDIIEALKNIGLYKGNYKCLTHGDSWSTNMSFKYKTSGEVDDIKIYDYQAICSNTPIHDLAYCFYSGASKQDMDKLDYYLDLYYRSFSDFARELGGVPEQLFPFEVLKKEWKHYGLMGIFLGCQLWALKLIEREDIENLLNQQDLPRETYWNHWNDILIRIRQGAEFRERARNIYLHAVEYGIL